MPYKYVNSGYEVPQLGVVGDIQYRNWGGYKYLNWGYKYLHRRYKYLTWGFLAEYLDWGYMYLYCGYKVP